MSRIRGKLLIVLAVVIVCITGCEMALGYFTDYEDAHGGAVIKLEGETEIEEKPEDDRKTVVISNTGKTDVIVRVSVLGEFMTVKADEKDWVNDGDYWYYRHILGPGEKTEELVAEIDVDAARSAGHDFDIVVVHESARVSYDGTSQNRVVKPDGWTYPDIEKGSMEVSD